MFEIDYTAARELYASYGDVATRDRGVHWHTDVTFVKRPPLGSILRAVVVPPAGGDTLFSDQQAAFDGLSPSLQDFLSTLTAVHDGRRQFQGDPRPRRRGRGGRARRSRSLEPVEHPVVRTHPETGERVAVREPRLHVAHQGARPAPRATPCSRSSTPTRSSPSTPSATTGAPGDLGFWDNRATQHAVVGDFGDAHRVIQRVTLRGDEPR